MASWKYCLLSVIALLFIAEDGLASDEAYQHAKRVLSALKGLFVNDEGELPSVASPPHGFTPFQDGYIRRLLFDDLKQFSQSHGHSRLHHFYPVQGRSVGQHCLFRLPLGKSKVAESVPLRHIRLHVACHSSNSPSGITARLSMGTSASFKECIARQSQSARRVLRRKRRQTVSSRRMGGGWLSFDLAGMLTSTARTCGLREVYVKVDMSGYGQLVDCASGLFEVASINRNDTSLDRLGERSAVLSQTEELGIRRAVQRLHETSRHRRSVGNRDRDCQVRHWNISWKDFGWDSFIIGPTTVEVNLCSGSCENAHDLATTTNHAILRQGWRNAVGNASISIVQCVPIRLEPIDVVHVPSRLSKDSKENVQPVEVSRWKELVVVKCGCR